MGLHIMLALAVLVWLASTAMCQNLLNNPNFEEAFGENNWYCVGGCTLEQATDAQGGQYSGKVTGR